MVEKSGSEVATFYKEHGLVGRVGFGARPAVVVVDFISGFTDTSSPLASDYTSELQATRRLLNVARERELPILYTTVAYSQSPLESNLFMQKIPSLQVLTEEPHRANLFDLDAKYADVESLDDVLDRIGEPAMNQRV